MGKALTLIFTGLVFIFKLLFWLFKVIVRAVGEIIIFFGLYIPGLYLLFGVILSKFTEFDINAVGLDRTLFLIGLGLCLVCSILLTVRKLIITPIKTVFSGVGKRTKKTISSRPDFRDEQRRVERNPYSPYPLEYRSKLYPDIKVREWSDRFELFKDDGEGEKFYKVEYKNK